MEENDVKLPKLRITAVIHIAETNPESLKLWRNVASDFTRTMDVHNRLILTRTMNSLLHRLIQHDY